MGVLPVPFLMAYYNLSLALRSSSSLPSCFVLPVPDFSPPQVIGQERFCNEYNKISAKATQAGIAALRN